MKKAKGIFALGLCAAMLLPAAVACGSGGGNEKGEITLTFWTEADVVNNEINQKIVNDYNAAHKGTVKIEYVGQSAGYADNLSSTLQGSRVPDVLQIGEKYFKGYAFQNLLTDLTPFLTEDDQTGHGDFSLADMYPSLVNRYRLDITTGAGGPGKPIFGIPDGAATTHLFYNKSWFKREKINVISVDEEDCTGNLKPHGYYVYDVAPTAEITQTRSDGKYYVFNDRIPMNWEELVALSELLTNLSDPKNPKYGFMNEWWFSHGWSVGGDCLEWSAEMNDGKGQFFFALGDTAPGYLVTGSEGVTLGSRTYAEGDVLDYEGKHYVLDHKSDEDVAAYLQSEKLYPLPSTRDAFSEFCQLSQAKGKTVDTGKVGYGISPSPTTLSKTGKTKYFTAQSVAMLVDEYNVMRNDFYTSMNVTGVEWGVAPLYQWRAYDAQGDILTKNGTPVVGKEAGHSLSTCLAVPRKVKSEKRKQLAVDFIKYYLGKTARAQYMEATGYVPIYTTQSEQYMNLPPMTIQSGKTEIEVSVPNRDVILHSMAFNTPGDWSYVENGNWIKDWSSILNSSVRDGDMTLTQFFQDKKVIATDATLKNYKAKEKYTGR